jgi:predicted amidophosphoribosyltransferase
MSNLPPGCRQKDIDGPCCQVCGEPGDKLLCDDCAAEEEEQHSGWDRVEATYPPMFDL